eukprot:TRINITY_DN6998_c1_g1_i2.p1 TRINITY_DN6998_c1_g1~~TRINITY_DN6998_c1_g1_i2.p1  ORF type:complete len:1754 (+),score=399.26 TRINITY_DN6998_c1_g1_i2:329-5590(+)
MARCRSLLWLRLLVAQLSVASSSSPSRFLSPGEKNTSLVAKTQNGTPNVTSGGCANCSRPTANSSVACPPVPATTITSVPEQPEEDCAMLTLAVGIESCMLLLVALGVAAKYLGLFKRSAPAVSPFPPVPKFPDSSDPEGDKSWEKMFGPLPKTDNELKTNTAATATATATPKKRGRKKNNAQAAAGVGSLETLHEDESEGAILVDAGSQTKAPPPRLHSETQTGAYIPTERDRLPDDPLRATATTEEAECQTGPQVFVELEPGFQTPLDLVCCLESSHLFGETGFRSAVNFLLHLLDEMDIPPVQMALLHFGGAARELASLDSSYGDLREALEVAQYSPGSATKLAPSLARARRCLEGGSTLRADPAITGRAPPRTAVLVLCSGDMVDPTEAKREIEALKESGHDVFAVRIEATARADHDNLAYGEQEEEEAFAAVGMGASSAHNWPLPGLAQDRHFLLRPREDPAMVASEILQSLVELSLQVRRARCVVHPAAYEEVLDINTVDGSDIIVPGWEAHSSAAWVWDPRQGVPLEVGRTVPWDTAYSRQRRPPPPALHPPMQQPPPSPACHEVATQTPTSDNEEQATREPADTTLAPPEPVPEVEKKDTGVGSNPVFGALMGMSQGAQTEAAAPGRARGVQTASSALLASAAGTQTDANGVYSSGVQTEPSVRLSVTPWRHEPIDLVICLDSSASFCLSRGPTTSAATTSASDQRTIFVASGTFERAKVFIECLAATVQMPEAHLALLRFEDEEPMCTLTDWLPTFLQKLRSVGPSAGETRFAPSLKRAVSMFQHAERVRSVQRSGSAEGQVAAKAVLFITDGDPNDLQDAIDAREQLQYMGAQLLFVNIAGPGQGPDAWMQRLAIAAPRPPPPASAAGSRGATLAPKGVFAVADDADALKNLVPDVLRQLLVTTQRVSRARIDLPLEGAEIVSEDAMDRAPGYDVQLSEEFPLVTTERTLWEPPAPGSSAIALRRTPGTPQSAAANASAASLASPPLSSAKPAAPSAADMAGPTEDEVLRARTAEAEAEGRCRMADAARCAAESAAEEASQRATVAEAESAELKNKLASLERRMEWNVREEEMHRQMVREQAANKSDDLLAAEIEAAESRKRIAEAARWEAEAKIQEATKRAEASEKESEALRHKVQELETRNRAKAEEGQASREESEQRLQLLTQQHSDASKATQVRLTAAEEEARQLRRTLETMRSFDSGRLSEAAHIAEERAESAEAEATELRGRMQGLEGELEVARESGRQLQVRAQTAETMVETLTKLLGRSMDLGEAAATQSRDPRQTKQLEDSMKEVSAVGVRQPKAQDSEAKALPSPLPVARPQPPLAAPGSQQQQQQQHQQQHQQHQHQQQSLVSGEAFRASDKADAFTTSAAGTQRYDSEASPRNADSSPRNLSDPPTFPNPPILVQHPPLSQIGPRSGFYDAEPHWSSSPNFGGHVSTVPLAQFGSAPKDTDMGSAAFYAPQTEDDHLGPQAYGNACTLDMLPAVDGPRSPATSRPSSASGAGRSLSPSASSRVHFADPVAEHTTAPARPLSAKPPVGKPPKASPPSHRSVEKGDSSGGKAARPSSAKPKAKKTRRSSREAEELAGAEDILSGGESLQVDSHLDNIVRTELGQHTYAKMQWLKHQLECQYGDLTTAFRAVDDTKTRRVTATKMVRELDQMGVSRTNAQQIFKTLMQLAECQKRGDMALKDWLLGFERVNVPPGWSPGLVSSRGDGIMAGLVEQSGPSHVFEARARTPSQRHL